MLTFLVSLVAPKVVATLGTVLSLILVDFIFGVLLALKGKTFAFSKLAQFMQTSLVPYAGGLLVLALFSNANAELGALFFTIATTVTVKFLADITAKVTQLFGGINIKIQSPIAVVKPAQIAETAPAAETVATASPGALSDGTVQQ